MLVYPPSSLKEKADRFVCFNNFLMGRNYKNIPFRLISLAAVAEKIGFEVKVVDYRFGGNFNSDLTEFQPDYLMVNVRTQSFKDNIEFYTIAKELKPDIITIGFGTAFLTVAQDIMYYAKDLDYIVYGEPEETLKELLLGIAPYRISGLYYRDNLRVKYTGTRPFNFDLDSLPFPARQLVYNTDNLSNNTKTVIEVSRGCPYQCFYGFTNLVAGSKVRKRSPQNIVDEIKECIEKYNIKEFFFLSDFFNADKKWVLDLCNLIIENNLDIIWETDIPAGNIDNETAKLMHKSGCRRVTVIADSGSEEILNNIGKKVSLDDIRLMIKLFKKFGIEVCSCFNLGLPWENEDTIEDTMDFALELDSDFVSFNIAAPFPGTKFYSYVKENNLINSDTSFKNAYVYPVVKTNNLSKEQISAMRTKAFKKFYLRPTFIFKVLFKLKTKKEFKIFIQSAIRLIPEK